VLFEVVCELIGMSVEVSVGEGVVFKDDSGGVRGEECVLFEELVDALV